ARRILEIFAGIWEISPELRLKKVTELQRLKLEVRQQYS
ncbi:hypothetical protein LINGRAHAP2_LOCUS941, partial [Linum grandiflorum]